MDCYIWFLLYISLYLNILHIYFLWFTIDVLVSNIFNCISLVLFEFSKWNEYFFSNTKCSRSGSRIADRTRPQGLELSIMAGLLPPRFPHRCRPLASKSEYLVHVWNDRVSNGDWMQAHYVDLFSCLRLRQWPVTYLITLSGWIMSCQPGRHAVVTVCEPDWKHKWAAYKSFDETSSFNNL